MVAGITLTASLKVGESIRVSGHTTDIVLVVESIQIDNSDVEEGTTGDSVGIKVPNRVRPGDRVYRLTH